MLEHLINILLIVLAILLPLNIILLLLRKESEINWVCWLLSFLLLGLLSYVILSEIPIHHIYFLKDIYHETSSSDIPT